MDFKQIKEIMKAFDNSNLSKAKIKNGDFEISFQKGFKNTNSQNNPVLNDYWLFDNIGPKFRPPRIWTCKCGTS